MATGITKSNVQSLQLPCINNFSVMKNTEPHYMEGKQEGTL